MTIDQIIRAWKSEEYHNSLEDVQIPANPVGEQEQELSDEELELVNGANDAMTVQTNGHVC